MQPVKTLIRMCACAGWSESSLGSHVRWFVLWRSGFYYNVHCILSTASDFKNVAKEFDRVFVSKLRLFHLASRFQPSNRKQKIYDTINVSALDKIVLLFFSRKLVLTFHANCLHWRQFAWNVKSVLENKKNHPQFVVCWISQKSGKG